MSEPVLDLRRPHPRSDTHPAVRPLLRVGVITAALVPLAVFAALKVRPLGRSPHLCWSPSCPPWYQSKAPQFALDVLGVMLVVAVVLGAAFGWAMVRHRHAGRRPILAATTVMTGLVVIALATPTAWTSLPLLDGRESYAWSALWLLAPAVVVWHRRLAGRSWPALLALVTIAPLALYRDRDLTMFFPALLWLISAAIAVATWSRRRTG